MKRFITPTALMTAVLELGLPVAFHTECDGKPCDRYYVHSKEQLTPQIERAFEAVKKHQSGGVLLFPYPNTFRW